MSDPTIIILSVAGLALVTMAYTAIGWNRARSVRYIFRGVGVILLLIAAVLTGVTNLVLEWIRAFVVWLRGQTMDATMTAGVVVAALGLLAFVIGSFINAPTREEAKARRLQHRTRQGEPVAPAVRPTPVSPAQPLPEPKPEPEETLVIPTGPTPAESSNPDDEVTAILKKHGIG